MGVLENVAHAVEELDRKSVLLGAGALFVVYWTIVILHRRFFHPLSHIPGPWLATTQLYQYYYDGILGGRFYHEAERLHKIYGPVLRVGPNEVHLCDPDNYDKIYSNTTRFYKDPGFYNIFGNPESHFIMSSNEMHRQQRAVLNPFFSRRAAQAQEDLIQEKARKMCDRVERDTKGGAAIWLGQAFRAMSVDVVTEYAFGKAHGYNFLDVPHLGRYWFDMIRGLNHSMPFLLLFPGLVKPMQSIPDRISVKMNPVVRDMVGCRLVCEDIVDEVSEEMEKGIQPEQETIFHGLISAGQEGELKGIKVTRRYLADEAFTIVGAGGETVGNALTIGSYHLIKRPDAYKKLVKELRDRFADEKDMTLAELEKLPYLTGVVKEALRTGYGVLKPLARVTPEGGATFNGHFIPEGTIVGMSCWFLHRHPDVFPDPDKFEPERWLVDQQEVFRLEHHLVPFSRGARACLGQNVAMAELYIGFGHLFWRFDDLETDIGPEDMQYESYFACFHPVKSRKFIVQRAHKA